MTGWRDLPDVVRLSAVRRRLAAGQTVATIALDLGASSPATITKFIHRHGLDEAAAAKAGAPAPPPETGAPAEPISEDDMWTEEAEALLKRRWTIDGASAREIAIDLGVSRNAVIGKVQRLGIAGRKPRAVAKSRAVAEPRAPAKPRTGRWSLQEKKTPVSVATAAEITAAPLRPAPQTAPPTAPAIKFTPPEVPLCERVTLMMLTAETCRWPMGDPGSDAFSFCGRRPEDGKPYCATHGRIAYQPRTNERAAPRAA